MALPARAAPRLRHLCRSASIPARAFTTTAPAAQSEQWPQRIPLCRYYEILQEHPAPEPVGDKPPSSAEPEPAPSKEQPEPAPAAPSPRKKKPGRKPRREASSAANPTPPGDPASSPPVPPKPTTAEDKARLVFGTPELTRQHEAARGAAKHAQSVNLAGVLVPPRPEEPDNCCMSGCVHCVWDLYRDEMEEWTAKKDEAQLRMEEGAAGDKAQRKGAEDTGEWARMGVRVSEAKIAKDLWDDETFQNVPVGIREFMRLEKKLKDTHKQEGE